MGATERREILTDQKLETRSVIQLTKKMLEKKELGEKGQEPVDLQPPQFPSLFLTERARRTASALQEFLCPGVT